MQHDFLTVWRILRRFSEDSLVGRIIGLISSSSTITSTSDSVLETVSWFAASDAMGDILPATRFVVIHQADRFPNWGAKVPLFFGDKRLLQELKRHT